MALRLLQVQWLNQTLLHWSFPPSEVQRLLPDGLVVDERDGRAWVSLTPFVMAHVRPAGVPATPLSRLASFPETNLRTYVRAADGREGLWFLTIEAANPTTLVARMAVGVPYHWADLSVTSHGSTVRYAGSRRGGGPSYRLTVRPGGEIESSDLDVWLTSRWRAYTRRMGIVWEVPVKHEPWALSSATLDDLQQTLLAAVGLPAPTGKPLVHYSAAVHHVSIGVPRPRPT
ncbi:YqjF family protein [Streptomyces sp. NPDC057445]|uniref:YqjF family protein n=1 Tax=Streptomyces sp. NPDC057445 TaxID=3346136 RepID=UPI003690CE09